MRDQLRGWYPPTDDEYERLWSQALIVLDASFLLTLYRYSDPLRNEFLNTLEQLRGRLWVPHQAALEYQRNRLEVITQQHNAYRRLRSELSQNVDRIRGAVGAFARHPLLEVGQITNEFDGALDRALGYLTSIEEADLVLGTDEAPGVKDAIRDHLTVLLSQRVGSAPSDGEVARVIKDGEHRYACLIPPGYRDREKPENRRYGDVFVWDQLLGRAAEISADVLFVTDDRKDDWWWIEQGRTIGPRPELVQEFVQRTQHLFYMYTPEGFLTRASQYLGQPVSDDVVDEAKEVAQQRVEVWRQMSFTLASHIANIESKRRSILYELGELRNSDSGILRRLAIKERTELRRTQEAERDRTRWRLGRLKSELASALPSNASAKDIAFLQEQVTSAGDKLIELESQLSAAFQDDSDAEEHYRRVNLDRLEARLAEYDAELEYLKHSLDQNSEFFS